MKSHRHVTAAVAVAMPVAILAGCSGSSQISHKGTSPVILFVGDSNLLFATSAISFTFFSRNDNYPFLIAARTGSGVRFSDCPGETEPCATHDYWRIQLDALNRRVKADAVVVNLGINDTAKLGSATTPGYADYGVKVDYLLRLIGNRAVLWTNLPCKVEPAARATGCAAVNSALAAATSRHRNLSVLDWASTANSHPGWMAKELGGVHYENAGYAAWAAMVATALDTRFKSG